MSRPQSFATRISSDIGRPRPAARCAPQPLGSLRPAARGPRPHAICTANIHHGIMTASVNAAVTAIFTAPHFAKSFRVT